MPGQKGIGHRWPLDQERTARISSAGGEREGVGRNSAAAAALHGQRRGARRSVRFGGYGPRFDEPRAPGEGGEAGELV